MWEDVIVEEVRQTRERHAEKFNFDLWAIYQDLIEQEKAGQRKLVRLPPRKRRRPRSTAKSRQPQILHKTQPADN
jgi:hypothetical protein